MKRLCTMLLKPNGAMSLGRVLVFLFGLEVLLLTPYVVYIGKENAPYVAFLIFFAGLFCALIYNKVVDAKAGAFGLGVKEGEQK